METIIDISLRTSIAFLSLLLMTRFLGKKQIGQLTFFTYITGIAMGNIAGQMAVEKSIPIIGGITGLIIWTILTFILEVVSLKSGRARTVLDGEPTIVIRNGIIQQRAIKKIRLNMDDLTMLLRNNSVFSVKEVDYAILEPNGKISILKKAIHENITKGDINIPKLNSLYLPTELIVDGRIIRKNLEEFNLTKDWLDTQLKTAGITDVKKVFFAELQSDGTLFIEKKTF